MRRNFENINLVGKSKIFYIISLSLIAVAIIFTALFGVEVDIQFKGGTQIKYTFTGEVDHDAFADAAQDVIGTTVNVTEGENIGGGGRYLQISVNSTAGLTADVQYELTNKLQESFPDNGVELLGSRDVNPSTGRDFFIKCFVAVIFAFVVLIIYIAFRFRKIGGWSAGAMAVIALLHDVAMVYATFVVFRIPIDANFMAVVLTILGYSINDTIVIYDRIRENRRLYSGKLPVRDLVNKSIGQSLTRSINTSVATVSALIVICIVGIVAGVESIFSFALPMVVGMISGAYSSICIAGPLWVQWREHREKSGGSSKKAVKVKAKA